jgi:hypothetical protein
MSARLATDWNIPTLALAGVFLALVTDTREHTVEVRALVSAADASQAWDLRCEVREQLVAFVQRSYPDSLPRIRASFAADPAERTSEPMSTAERIA